MDYLIEFKNKWEDSYFIHCLTIYLVAYLDIRFGKRYGNQEQSIGNVFRERCLTLIFVQTSTQWK